MEKVREIRFPKNKFSWFSEELGILRTILRHGERRVFLLTRT